MVFKMIVVVASFGFCAFDKYINFMLGVWIFLLILLLFPLSDSFDQT